MASGDDAVHADETLTVTACDMNISESYEGLEALHIDIQGGTIKLVATDDGLNVQVELIPVVPSVGVMACLVADAAEWAV